MKDVCKNTTLCGSVSTSKTGGFCTSQKTIPWRKQGRAYLAPAQAPYTHNLNEGQI